MLLPCNHSVIKREVCRPWGRGTRACITRSGFNDRQYWEVPLEKSGTQRRMLIAIPLRHTSQPGVNKCCQVFVVFFLLNFSPLVSGYVTVSLIIRPLQSLEHMRICRHWSNKQDMDMMWNFYGVNKETMLRGDSNGSKGA